MSRGSFEQAGNVQEDLRVAPRPVIAVLIVLGLALSLVGDSVRPPLAPLLLNLSLLFYALGFGSWLAYEVRAPLGQWLAVVAAGAGVLATSLALSSRTGLVLMWIPSALAAAIIGLQAAALFAVAGTVLEVVLFAMGETGSEILAVGLVGIWASVGVSWSVQWRMNRIAAWTWTRYIGAQKALDEARDRQAELKQTTEDLARANQQLLLLNDRVAGLRLLAEEAEKAKAEFVAKVSHELRTPLNIIVGLTELLVEAPHGLGAELPDTLREPLEIVHRNSRHLSNMIDDVLDLSQVEAGRMSLRREWVDLREIVQRAVSAVRPLTQPKNLYLNLMLPDNLPQVYCDRTRILQVIVNLVSNAARFTENGGITVSAVAQDGSVVVSVADTGPGITLEDAERIFEPFCQGRTRPWRQKDGSGLGLSISKQFVSLHGGRIWLETELGTGSTFHFELPVGPPPTPETGSRRWIVEDWVDHAPRSRLPERRLEQRIVLYDETGELYPVLHRYSDDVEYISASAPEQAAEALKVCASHALLLNAASPEKLWPLVLEAAREVKDTPIIGWSCPPSMQGLPQGSIRGYLTKPVSREDLRAALDVVGKPVERILVVDNDEDAQLLFVHSLRSIVGAVTIEAVGGGREALDEMRQRPPDVVLLDLVMPEFDGWQVLSEKEHDEAIRDIPVFVISALDPRQEPIGSAVLAVALGKRMRLSQLVQCSREIPKLLLNPG